MELNCPQHENVGDVLIVGEDCLKEFFRKNNGACPIQLHNNCRYSKTKLSQIFIDDLQVICSRQFQQDLKISKQSEMIETIRCNFKGKLKNLHNHLNIECSFALVGCWFKPFGCNHTCYKQNLDDHLISTMRFHFDLVISLFQYMKQAVQFHQDTSNQLKFEIERLKKDVQCKMENLRQEALKYQSDIEIIKKNFNSKQLTQCETSVKLKEKDPQSACDYQKVTVSIDNQIEKKQKESNNNVTNSSSILLSSINIIDFDMFHQSAGLLKTFIGHTDYVYGIDYATFDDGQFICSGSIDKTIRVWDVETIKQIQSFNGHSDYVNCVKFSPYHYYNNCRHVTCSSSVDKTILDNICALDHLTILFVYGILKRLDKYIFLKDTTYCLVYTICSGSHDETICIWDIETTKQSIIFKGHKDPVYCVKYGSNESANTILSGSLDKSVRLWDIRSHRQIQVFNGDTHAIYAVEYLPFIVNNNQVSDCSNVICSGSLDNTVRFWDIRSNKSELHVIKGDDKDGRILSLKFLSLKKKNENLNNDAYKMGSFIFGDSQKQKTKNAVILFDLNKQSNQKDKYTSYKYIKYIKILSFSNPRLPNDALKLTSQFAERFQILFLIKKTFKTLHLCRQLSS
ncbi:WD repeat-containing protein [Reticulomyxa filosa]|uniref:WD repeat-containing protein n=1 Tax=Reticulomyxa filosa TaxID=46433 RepID=X6NCX8_RETFI|nr:WD repeat-containing protein [Reticulomyxa filosa]|eukprot:ETO24180.1 WD repeat-containing protein [Reticulomyxa filosa]